MLTITTRRSILRFYILLSFFLLFTITFGCLIMSMMIHLAQQADHNSISDYILTALGAFIIFLGIYSVYSFYRNSPTITVDHNSISFNSDKYNWADIKEITLTGKQPFKSAFAQPMEGAKFTCSDGTERYMFDYMYANAPQVKSFIQQVVIDKSNFNPLPDTKTSKAELDNEDFETFKDPQLTSFRGITCWGLVGIMAFASVANFNNKGYSGAYIFAGTSSALWLVFHGWLMHNFKVSQNFLVIKDHIFFWQNTPFRFSDIKEVVFETRQKQPNSLRVITKDFHSKLYPAGTLRDKTWLLMKDKLESCGVKVRNECTG